MGYGSWKWMFVILCTAATNTLWAQNAPVTASLSDDGGYGPVGDYQSFAPYQGNQFPPEDRGNFGPTQRLPVAAAFTQTVAPLPPPDKDAKDTKDAEADAKAKEKSKTNSAANAAQISQGRVAFDSKCTTCHDANKSLDKRKSFSAWRATVQRMASKDGADIAASEIAPIAAYLASLSSPAAGGGGEGDDKTSDAGSDDAGPNFTLFGTVSPTWRGGNDNLQNSGFFPDAWVGVNWQNASPVSARVTACVSCHTEPGEGSRIELVDAVVRVDLMKAFCCGDTKVKSSLEAGRFIVPFGAFAQQSNPGVYRTVTRPLIYNMGFRVHEEDLGDPVLPMPYSDEGAMFNLGIPIGEDYNAAWTTYVINGLQSTAEGIDFDLSRDYVDNNQQPALGTRVTWGGPRLKLGTSFMSGQSSPTGGVDPNETQLYYRIYGVDATYRYEDWFRIQAEYAKRDSDRIIDDPLQPFRSRDHVDGFYVESELFITQSKKVSILARYDHQYRSSLAPPGESVLTTGTFNVNRFTYGVNFTLPGGSLFMINHERWLLPQGLEHTDVLGLRWAASF